MTATSGHATDADLVGMRVGHRAMRADLHRLTATVTSLAGNGVPTTRARAVADYVDVLVASIENHHRNEDDYLWPVLRSVAGDQIDLGELVDDHRSSSRYCTRRPTRPPDCAPGSRRPHAGWE